MQRRVVIEESVSLSLGNYLVDSAGLTKVLEAIDALVEDPRPPNAVPWGRVMTRLHIGPYRVLYEIGKTTIWVRRIDRVL
jgi:mRNA-degrading endonuclease RelE of RelBE toxin-antitoxin system